MGPASHCAPSTTSDKSTCLLILVGWSREKSVSYLIYPSIHPPQTEDSPATTRNPKSPQSMQYRIREPTRPRIVEFVCGYKIGRYQYCDTVVVREINSQSRDRHARCRRCEAIEAERRFEFLRRVREAQQYEYARPRVCRPIPYKPEKHVRFAL